MLDVRTQREVCLKIRTIYDSGGEVGNPIKQLADHKYMATLSHEARQRYILILCGDYVEMKRLFLQRLAESPTGTKRTRNLG